MQRIIFFTILLAAGMTAFGQEKQPNLGLIPTPQRVEMGNGYCTRLASQKMPQTVYVDSLPVDANIDQAYQLIIGKNKITIRCIKDGHGQCYAMRTLGQLEEIYGDNIPCCTITDWPAYRYRGWMDDISRGPVPHQAFRTKQWQRLHALKYNYCNYYTEHTLYQPEFPDLAPAYAAACKPHPDEVINLQLFAHAEKTLRVPFYQHMMDSKVNFNPSVEETYGFLKKRIAAAYDRIPNSPFFIINCDETEQLGTGRAKKLVDSLGADQVYVDFINRCYNMINRYHWDQWEGTDKNYEKVPDAPRIAIWGDIVAKNPAMMKQLPKDMIYIMWAYEPIDSFTHLIKPFKEQGNPFWVAASTGHSATMTSTPQRYIKNIANLFRDGYRDGAEGCMLTCWDDNGEALFDNSWHAQYWAAEMAWKPLKTDDPEELRQREAQFNQNFERLFYGHSVAGDSVASKTSDLYAVGALMYNPTVGDWYTSAALMEPLLNFNPDNTGDAMPQRIDCVIALINEIHIDSAANPHAHYAISRMKMSTRKANLRYLLYRKLFDLDSSHWNVPMSTVDYFLEEMREFYLQELFALKREYLRLWDQENGDYERYIVMNRYDDLAREVLELDRHVFVEIGTDSSPLASLGSPSPNLEEEPDRKTAAASSPSKLEGVDAKRTGACVYPMVTLRTLYNDRPIYYTLDGSEPTASSTKYEGPFPLERSATIKAISYNKYGEGVVTEQYLLSHLGMGAKITLNTKYSDYKAIYSGGGDNALIDGQLGSNTTYADGHWQGYWGDSIDAVISLTPDPSPTGEGRWCPKEISMRFMQNTFDWILAPKEIKVYVSDDGNHWRLQKRQQFDMDPRETGMRLRNYTVELNNSQPSILNSQFLRIVVPNPGPLPDWHPAPGQPSYLFTDEIIIR